MPIERSGNVYILKDNILNYSITIEKNNVVIDGNGSLLEIPAYGETDKNQLVKGANPLIQISNKSNIIIKNIVFDKYSTGIYIRNFFKYHNTINNGNTGIYMLRSANCSVVGNKLIENSGPGLSIHDSTYLDIAYNTISRNHEHGGYISGLSNSNISRNDIAENFLFSRSGLGLYITLLISNSCIFENNFVNNGVGLDFHCFENSSGNLLYNNYWSNHRHQIYDHLGYAVNGVDQSPLASPVSTSFDPSLFPLPSLTPTPSPESRPTSEPFPIVLVATSTASAIVVVGLGLLVYFKKRKH